MTISKNSKVVLCLSAILFLLYVVMPLLVDYKADYGDYVQVVYVGSMLYTLFLPAVLGIVGAVILQGDTTERIVKLGIALAIPLVGAVATWGQSGLSSDSFRLGMILFAVVAGIYLLIGALSALYFARRGSQV